MKRLELMQSHFYIVNLWAGYLIWHHTYVYISIYKHTHTSYYVILDKLSKDSLSVSGFKPWQSKIIRACVCVCVHVCYVHVDTCVIAHMRMSEDNFQCWSCSLFEEGFRVVHFSVLLVSSEVSRNFFCLYLPFHSRLVIASSFSAGSGDSNLGTHN